ncbi:hypothetical protein [Streptomyces sp. NPDC005077]|uniref:hypothetical protein n=2 Tax=unclassified Streptomyces TaxID=2593676 RepID=UPI0033A7E454
MFRGSATYIPLSSPVPLKGMTDVAVASALCPHAALRDNAHQHMRGSREPSGTGFSPGPLRPLPDGHRTGGTPMPLARTKARAVTMAPGGDGESAQEVAGGADLLGCEPDGLADGGASARVRSRVAAPCSGRSTSTTCPSPAVAGVC